MTGTPEISPQFPAEVGHEQKPQFEPTPEPMEQGTGTKTPQPTAQQPVTDPTSQPSDPTNAQSIQVPESEEKLKKMSKGSPTDAVTWLAMYWIRIIKKATHLGWKIVGKQEP